MYAFKLSQAVVENGITRLNWNTATEPNNSGFNLQRSNDTKKWSTISFTKSKANQGTSQAQLDYQVFDYQPKDGKNYYRLEQLDFDGQSTYCNIVVVNIASSKDVTIFLNPAGDQVILNVPDQTKVKEIRIIDLSDKVNYRNIGKNGAIDLSQLAAGHYFLNIIFTDNTNTTLPLNHQ